MLIELCGTPSSGKSATVEALKQNGSYTPFRLIEESILRCPFDDSNFELGVLWTIFETYAEANRLASSNGTITDNGLTVFNRGLFDRIVFSRLLRAEDTRYAELAERAEKWLKGSKQLLCFDKIFLFLTTYEKARERKLLFKLRQNSTFRIVNPTVIGRLNTIYLELYAELSDRLPIIMIDDLNNNLSLEQKVSIVTAHIDSQR